MDYRKAANYWNNKTKNIAPDELIIDTVQKVLGRYRHCTLATASAEGVDATAVHYIYMNNLLYIFSEGGEKFVHLEKNKKVAVSVYNPDGDFGNLHSVQVYGKADFVEVLSEEYMEVVKNSVYNLNSDFLKRRAEIGEPLYLIRINPSRYKITDSDFKKQEFDVNQTVTVAYNE